MDRFYFTSFGAVYNCGAYGSGSFDEGALCGAGNPTDTSTSTDGSQSGGLVNTGANFYVPLIGGVVLIIVALAIVIVSLKKRNKKA